MIRQIVSLGGIGFLPRAPGTFASAAAIPLAWVLHCLGGFILLALATLLASALGWWASREYLRASGGDGDPSEVVIDELAGQWIALWPLSLGMVLAGSAPHVFPYPGWISAFLLFRLFDIWKPGPVGWADRLHGATGIMLDDLIAGVLAALVSAILAALAHLVLM